MGEVLRLFVALPVPAALQLAAGRLQDRLRRTGADVSFPSPASLHVTLVFLGDTSPDALPGLMVGLERVVAGRPRFGFQVAGLGLFGPPRQPRVVWAGLADPPPVLFDLHNSVLAMVSELGFTTEKRSWHPHLTLGRIRSSRGLAGLTDMVDSLKGETLDACPVEQVQLVRSRLDQPGPRYEILQRVQLKGN